MRRDKLGIGAHCQGHAFLEEIFGDGRDGDHGCRVLHAFCVAVGSEDGYFAVAGVAESFETFVDLLAVVKTGGHAVDVEEGGGHEAWT